MEKGIETWNEKGLGNKLSDEKRDCTSNLRFAGEVLMMVTSMKQLKRLIVDFKKCTEAQGGEIHPERKFSPTRQQTY